MHCCDCNTHLLYPFKLLKGPVNRLAFFFFFLYSIVGHSDGLSGTTANTTIDLSQSRPLSCVSTLSLLHFQDGDQSMCIGGGFLATTVSLRPYPARHFLCCLAHFICICISVNQSLLLQKTIPTLTVQDRLFSQPQEGSSMSDILYPFTLPTAHHTVPSFFDWLCYISPPRELLAL